jgi:hypothetical protein
MRVGWPALALTAAACTGYVGTPTGQAGGGAAGAGNGTAGAPNPTGGGGPGAPGSAGTAASSGALDPNRVTIRQLARAEYDNTVHDLLGTSQTPGATTFPDDVPALGFDNDGDLQNMTPVLFTLYQQAAESLAAEVMTVGSAERASLDSIAGCSLASGASCAQSFITNFGLRAFRRPLTAAEVTNFVTLMSTAASDGATTTDQQYQTVIEAFLQSPNFIFKPEIDANPTSLTPHLLSPYETATRLSYMVYRSMPDQGLFSAAAAGTLATVSDLQTQLTRMLADPKAAFAPTFVSEWLGTSVVATQTFDSTLFPQFSASVAASMGDEVNDVFTAFLQSNEPLPNLLTTKSSYIDSNLASLYGIPAPSGTGLTLTTLDTPQRGGLLTMAGVLSVTSYPTRVSAVKRGAFVLSQLMCAPPPAPPANVPPFPTGTVTGTMAQILAAHRTDPSCAACHASMDPIGLSMENYDAIGVWQTTENGLAIDASGSFTGQIAEPTLPTGAMGPTFTGVAGPNGLEAAVAADSRYVPCVAQNALTYAIGRALQPTDTPYLTQITTPTQAGAVLGMRDVLMNVVANDTFRMRRGDTTTPTTSTGAMP